MILEQNLYLLAGVDAYLIKKNTDKILAGHGIAKEDVEVYDMEEVSLAEAIDHAMTIPFLSDKKGVVLANACFLGGLKPQKDVVHPLETLSAYLADPNPTTIMIIQAPYEKLDRTTPLLKQLTDRAEIVSCAPDKNDDVFQEIKDTLAKNKLKIDANALQMFVSRVGPDRLMLKHELDKLIAYACGLPLITAEMIRDIVYKNPDDHIYLLVNAVIEEDTQMLIRTYQELLSASVDAMWMLAAIIAKFQEILYAKELLKQNYKQEDIMRYFSASKGRAFYIMKNAREVTDARLMDFLGRLEALDAAIKTGQIDKELGLELFLMRLYVE